MSSDRDSQRRIVFSFSYGCCPSPGWTDEQRRFAATLSDCGHGFVDPSRARRLVWRAILACLQSRRARLYGLVLPLDLRVYVRIRATIRPFRNAFAEEEA